MEAIALLSECFSSPHKLPAIISSQACFVGPVFCLLRVQNDHTYMEVFMKLKIFFVFVLMAVFLSACSDADKFAIEANAAKYKSEYARVVNKLELSEGDFKTYRRVVFYNVRLGETVFVAEGFCNVNIDDDGDVELVVKVDDSNYLRHYLGQKQDITYFSEQMQVAFVPSNSTYKIYFNPKLWLPSFEYKPLE